MTIKGWTGNTIKANQERRIAMVRKERGIQILCARCRRPCKVFRASGPSAFQCFDFKARVKGNGD